MITMLLVLLCTVAILQVPEHRTSAARIVMPFTPSGPYDPLLSGWKTQEAGYPWWDAPGQRLVPFPIALCCRWEKARIPLAITGDLHDTSLASLGRNIMIDLGELPSHSPALFIADKRAADSLVASH